MLLWVWCLSAGHSTLLAPCARSPGSDPCQIAAAAQRDKRSPGEPADLAGGNWGKGSKWFKWQNHPLGITGGDNGQQSCLRRGDVGKKDWSEGPRGRWWSSCHIPLLNVTPRKAGQAAPTRQPGTCHLCSVTALGTARAPCSLPAPQPASHPHRLPGSEDGVENRFVHGYVIHGIWTLICYRCSGSEVLMEPPAHRQVAPVGNSVARRSFDACCELCILMCFTPLAAPSPRCRGRRSSPRVHSQPGTWQI